MKIFVTGIGTDVGKTIASAIITEALEADYWKPVQAGDLDNSDSHKIKKYISNSRTIVHPSAYTLNTPASPHLAALIDEVEISTEIEQPHTQNHLVIEGAGGILVPLNASDTIADLIKHDYKVIVVSRHYLGSINHTLLTCEVLKARNVNVAGIIFNGDENASTEDIILSKTGIPLLGRIENEPYFDENVVRYYADKFRDKLTAL